MLQSCSAFLDGLVALVDLWSRAALRDQCSATNATFHSMMWISSTRSLQKSTFDSEDTLVGRVFHPLAQTIPILLRSLATVPF